MSLKSKCNQTKIHQSKVARPQDEGIGLSFKYLTSNSDHNFSYFKKNKNECIKSKAALYDRIEEITKESWMYWYNQSKFTGIETLPVKSITFKPSGYEFSDGDKVIVFRFNGNDGRIIGFKIDSSPFYYVIGFDFDHSAYDHGS